MKFFLDTNICIYLLKGRYEAIGQRMRQYAPTQLAIPSIVQAELLIGGLRSGNPKKALSLISELLAPLSVVAFCSACASAYAEIRHSLEKAGTTIGPHDLIIAATVIANGGTLVSHNTREFRRVPGLLVQDWTERVE